jgi:hypothetical protein
LERLAEQAHVLAPDRRITLAGPGFQPAAVEDRDPAAVASDQVLALQLAHGVRDAFAAHAHDLGDHLLRDRQLVRVQPVHAREDPVAGSLPERVLPGAPRHLPRLRDHRLGVAHEQVRQRATAPQLGLQPVDSQAIGVARAHHHGLAQRASGAQERGDAHHPFRTGDRESRVGPVGRQVEPADETAGGEIKVPFPLAGAMDGPARGQDDRFQAWQQALVIVPRERREKLVLARRSKRGLHRRQERGWSRHGAPFREVNLPCCQATRACSAAVEKRQTVESNPRLIVLGTAFAIAVAMLGVATLDMAGIRLGGDTFPPYRTTGVSWVRYIAGGFLFGVGMALGSGCGDKTLRGHGCRLRRLASQAFAWISSKRASISAARAFAISWGEPSRSWGAVRFQCSR